MMGYDMKHMIGYDVQDALLDQEDLLLDQEEIIRRSYPYARRKSCSSCCGVTGTWTATMNVTATRYPDTRTWTKDGVGTGTRENFRAICEPIKDFHVYIYGHVYFVSIGPIFLKNAKKNDRRNRS